MTEYDQASPRSPVDASEIAEDATQIDRHIDYTHVLTFNWLGLLVSLGGAYSRENPSCNRAQSSESRLERHCRMRS
jgi:hypothetical protein